jgi:hypothetical protein
MGKLFSSSIVIILFGLFCQTQTAQASTYTFCDQVADATFDNVYNSSGLDAAIAESNAAYDECDSVFH